MERGSFEKACWRYQLLFLEDLRNSRVERTLAFGELFQETIVKMNYWKKKTLLLQQRERVI